VLQPTLYASRVLIADDNSVCGLTRKRFGKRPCLPFAALCASLIVPVISAASFVYLSNAEDGSPFMAMSYGSSHGELHVMRYLVMGSGCQSQPLQGLRPSA